MANEAILRQNESAAGNVVHQMTCSNLVGIEKGALLKLTDPNTAVLSDGDVDVLAGIAASEKVASDGNTIIGVHKKGVFELIASNAIAVGAPVVSASSTGGANYVATGVGANASGAAVLGYALETAADAERILVRLDL